MEKSHLVHILRTFDKKEVKELRKWVNSPAHNQREDVVSLFEFLMTGNHLFDEKYLTKEKVFAAVYYERTYNDAEMRQVMHFLLKSLEDYLAYSEFLKDDVRAQAMLARAYRQRQLPKLFQKTMDAVRKTQELQPFRHHQYFENEYLIQFEEYVYLSGLSRTVPLNLQEISTASDTAFIINKLQIGSIMLSHQTVFKAEYATGLLDAVLAHIENRPELLTLPAIAIYYYSYKSGADSINETHFQQLKWQLNQHSHLFPAHEIRSTYLFALNYCIGKLNTGTFSYVREAFDMYRVGLSRNIFLENGMLSRFTFRNIVAIALQLQEFKWVEKFIHEYREFLEEKYRDSFVTFNLARLHFERKEYNQAMKLLAQSDYDDLLMSLNAKTMLLKMYYELDEISALESLLESMRTYLQRKKVMGYHKSNYKNIIHFTKKLLRVPAYGKEQKEKLSQEIAATNPLTERKWLQEQLDKL